MMRNKNNIAKKEKQRFSIRKLSVGAVSVLLGTTIFWGAPDVAHAATADAENGTQKINSEETNKQQNNLNQQKVTLGSQPKTESSQSKTDSKQSDPAQAKQATDEQKQAQQQATMPSQPKTEGSQPKTDSKPSDPAQTKQAADNQKPAKKSVKVAKTAANDNSEERTVTYQFIDPDGNLVTSYTAPTGSVGSTVKIDQDEFNQDAPRGYYFADPNFKVPTSYTYTDDENPTIKINVKSLNEWRYTINFQDETDGSGSSEVTWDARLLDSLTHQQADILANLNQWIQKQGNSIKYHGYYQNNPDDPNLSKYPVSADLITPLPLLTALPDQGTTEKIYFKHHFYDVTGQIPLWQAPNVQLTKEGMDTLLKAFNSTHKEGGTDTPNMNPGLVSFTASTYFKSLLPQIFKGAKWTSGGLIVTDQIGQSHDDYYSGGQDWNLFNTNGSGSNLLSPLYQRPTYNLDLQQNDDKFYLTNDDYKKLATEFGQDLNTQPSLSAIVGQLPMLKYQAKFDGFNPSYSRRPDPNNNGQLAYMIDNGDLTYSAKLKIESTNINDNVAGKTISAGYDIKVLIPVVNQSNNTVKYELVSVQSHDLQNATTINDIYKLYEDGSSSLDGRIIGSGVYAVVQPNSDGTYSWTLSNIGSGYGGDIGGFGALAHDYSDPNYAVKFLKKAYSPIYNEAIKEALKESRTTDFVSTLDGYTPLTMFYVLTPETESATITYIDDATHKTLKTETTTGPFDSEITFANDPTDVIQSYVQQGYTLVSNDFNNQKFQVSGNSFTVHLTSASGNSDNNNGNYVSDQSETRHVTRTINVTNPDGTTTTITQVATITRTGKYYSDSGQTVWGDWSTDSNSWAAYQVPAI